MSMKIALVGNPNSGKTTIFNALTGSNQYVGNWPGVTVEKKGGIVKWNKDIEVVDLPGIYSLSPYTPEEIVTRDFIINEKPDLILNIVDSTSIERSLYLTTQLMEMNIPLVVALNMSDILEKNGDEIDVKKLSQILNCPVIKMSAVKGGGMKEAIEKGIEQAKKGTKSIDVKLFPDELEQSLEKIENIIKETTTQNLAFLRVKVFERDQRVLKQINLMEVEKASIEKIIRAWEERENDDAESIIISKRYTFIANIVPSVLKLKTRVGLTLSDKIDRVVTNKFLAFPIFAGVMFLLYFVCVSTLGAWMTDWTNDVLFGEIIAPGVEGFLINIGTAEWLNSLITEGIIGGVGAVIGFVPQLLLLFLFLSILEDCGYMGRVAFIMDKVFRKFGLSGKSFIPMLVGTGCSVPGIMASRTIESEKDRRMTIITTSFIPCGAKVPIIALIAGAMFGGAWWVAPSAYFVGIAAVILSGLILKKTKAFSGEGSPFVMELPAYHLPILKNVLNHTWDRGWSFIKKAGTVIFLSCGIIWFLSNFNISLQMVDTNTSMLSTMGKWFAPAFAPLGFGTWEATVATFTGLVAKENVVGTLGVLFGSSGISENGQEIWGLMGNSFTTISAYSFLLFNLLCAPCFGAIAAIKREMNSAKWTVFAILYQTGLAYGVALIFNQLGMFIRYGTFTLWSGVALLLLGGIMYMLLKKEVN